MLINKWLKIIKNYQFIEFMNIYFFLIVSRPLHVRTIIIANKPKDQNLKHTLENKDLQEQFESIGWIFVIF